MIWHSIKQALIGYALRATWSSATLVFLGFLIPRAFFGASIDLHAEVMAAGKIDWGILVALGQGEIDVGSNLLLSPFAGKPFSLLFGRYGLMGLLPALAILLAITLFVRLSTLVAFVRLEVSPHLPQTLRGTALLLSGLCMLVAGIGFAIPGMLFGLGIEPWHEIVAALKLTRDLAGAIASGVGGDALNAILAPLAAEPAAFAVGRYGLLLLPLPLALFMLVSMFNRLRRRVSLRSSGTQTVILTQMEDPYEAADRLRRR